MDNGKEILDQIKKIKEDYEVQPSDFEEEQLSFLDRMNKLIKLILNDNSESIYSAMRPDILEKWKDRRFSRFFKKILGNPKDILYFSLLVTITAFLVSEALSFYAIDDIITTKTYLKAILTEVSFIFLSGYRSSGKLNSFFVSAMRVSVFGLMLFVISSETLMHGIKNTGNTNAITQQVIILEKQIEAKEKDIKYYKETKPNWAITIKQLILEKDEMVRKLIALKEKQAEGSNEDVSDMVRYKSYGNAFFRVLLLFISVLITRRMFIF